MGVKTWSRIVAVLAVVAGLSPMAPAAAVTSVRSTSPNAAADDLLTELAGGLPSDAHVAVARDGRRQTRNGPADIALGVRGFHDRSAWMSAAAALVEERSEGEVAVAAQEPQQGGKVVDAVPAGDLDADGRADVLAVTADLGSGEMVLQGRRGDDATVLWEQRTTEDGALLWPLGTDVNGDGTDDLAVEGLRISSERSVEQCEEFEDEEWCWPVEYEAVFTWTIGIASGATGETLWTRDFDGALSEKFTETSGDSPVVDEWGERYEVRAENLFLAALQAGDLSGTGHEDLVTNALDLAVVETYDGQNVGPIWTDSGSMQVRSETRADVVDAATGEVRSTFTDSADGRVAFLSPVAHGVGGSGPDLLWERSIEPDQSFECLSADVVVDWVDHCTDEWDGGYALEIAMVDGQTLAEAWSARLADGWTAFGLGQDLDADGRGDVMALAFADDGLVTAALSGASGTTLWSLTSEEDFHTPVVAAELDAVPGVDLVTATLAGMFEEDAAMVTERRNGRTGAVLSRREHPIAFEDGGADVMGLLAYAAGSDDGDGDGVGDLTVGWIQLSYDFDEEDAVEKLSSEAYAESGATGGSLRHLDAPDEAAFLLPLGDLDGDGLVDLVEERYTQDDAGETVAWTTVPFGSGAPRWSTTFSGASVWPGVAGDQDGQPGEELLVTTYLTDPDGVSSHVTSVSGRTGAERWRLTPS